MNTDTPRTDVDVESHQWESHSNQLSYRTKLCRQLEKKLNKANRRADGMERAGAEQTKRADENYEVIKQLRAEVAERHAGYKATCDELTKVRAEVERLKTELLAYGHRASETSIEFNDMRQERDQWREDAERLAKCVEHSVVPTGPMMFAHIEENKQALAAHGELLKQHD